MAKKQKLITDDFDLDSELDFGDFDAESISGAASDDVKKTNRSPVTKVFKGTIGGVKSAAINPSVLKGVLRHTLPKEYGEVVDSTGDVTGNVAALYNDAVKEIKPVAKRMVKQVSRLVPDEAKRTKSFMDRLNKILGGDDETRRKSDEENRENDLQAKLAEVFQAQSEEEGNRYAESKAEDKIKEGVDAKRFQTSHDLLSSISTSVGRLSAYNDKINQAYQRKSLEMQFRSFYVQNELNENAKKFFEIFKYQNDAIVKNTGLPEYSKIQQSERFKDLARNKFMDNLREGLFGNGEFLKRGMANIRERVKEKVGSVKSAFEQGASLAEDSADMREQMKEMSSIPGMEDAIPDKYGMAGNIIGGGIFEHVANKAGKKVRNKFFKPGSKVSNFGLRAAKGVGDLPGLLDKLNESKYVKDNFDDYADNTAFGGIKRFGKSLLRSGLESFGSGAPDMQLDTGQSSIQLSLPEQRTANKSLTTIIPGYLARIFREIQILRTGNEKIDLTTFDARNDKFVSKTELANSTKAFLAEKSNERGYQQKLDELTKHITAGKKVSAGASKALKDKLREASLGKKTIDAELLRHPSFLYGLDKNITAELKELIESSFNPDQEGSFEKDYNLNQRGTALKKSVGDVRGEIQQILNSGNVETLRQLGLTRRLPDGSETIDYAAYKKLVTDEPSTTGQPSSSDERGESKIAKILKSAKTKRKTKTASSVSSREIRHPFPILAKQATVGTMETKSDITPIASAIKTDTGLIVEKLSGIDFTIKESGNQLGKTLVEFFKNNKMQLSDGTAQRSSGGKPIGDMTLSDIASSIKNMVVGGSLKLGSAVLTTVSTAKNKLFDPAFQKGKELFRDNKDPVMAAAKDLYAKGFKLVGDVYTRAKDTLTDVIQNKIPSGYAQLVKMFNFGKDKILDYINQPVDVYIKGFNRPALRAVLMRAGAYYDQASGKVIETLADIKGVVVNQAGEVVLSLEDFDRGLIDSKGQEIKLGLKKISDVVINKALAGIKKGKELIGKFADAARGVKDVAVGVAGGVAGRLTGGGGGGRKAVKLLTEIRDLLNTRLPGEQATFNDTDGDGQRDGSWKGMLGKTKTSEPTEAASEQTNDPRYASGGNIIDTMTNKGKALYQTAKDRYTQSGMKDKLTKKTTTLRGKMGGMFSRAKDMFTSGAEDESQPSMLDNAKTTGLALAQQGKDKYAASGLKTKVDSAKESVKNKYRQLSSLKKPAFNDTDGDGQREGSWKALLDKRREAADERKKKRDAVKPNLDPRYKSTENVIDMMARKAKAAFGFIKDGLGGLADMVDLGGKGGKGGLLKRAGSMLARGGRAVAGGLVRGVGSIASRVGVGGLARAGLAVGSLSTSGLASAAMGGASLIGGILSSPVVLGAGAVALTGYGLYKGYKYFTRNDSSLLSDVRMRQYGLTKDHSDKYHHMFELEDYLASEAIGYSNGQAYIMQRKLDVEKVLSIFSIDESDENEKSIFIQWFNNRFKPVFLTHLTALFAIDNKCKLDEIDKLKPEDQLKYIDATAFLNGPYNSTVSPFKDLAVLPAGKASVEEAVNAVKADLSSKVKKDGKSTSRVGAMFASVKTALGFKEKETKEPTQGSSVSAITKAVPSLLGTVLLPVKLAEFSFKAGTKLAAYMGFGVSALESVRFKTYGLKDIERGKVSSLRGFENYVADYVKLGSDGVAEFTGDINKVIADYGKDFGLSSINDPRAVKWVSWFRDRFLPVFLNYLGLGFQLTSKKTPNEIDVSLKDAQKLEVATKLSGISGVWEKTDSPWADIVLGTSATIIQENLEFLKEKAKKETVAEEKIAVAKKLDTKITAPQTQKPGDKNAPLGGLKEPTPPPVAKITQTSSPTAEGETAKDVGVANMPKNVESKTTGTSGTMKVPVVSGPMASGDKADPFLKKGGDVDLDNLNPAFRENFRGMVAEYGEKTGKSFYATSGKRSREKQEALYRQNPKLAAKPGRSLHEFGLALDGSSQTLNEMDSMGLMRKYGLTRPVGGEPWHVEPAGIQTNIQKAKEDTTFAQQAIAASIGKGGGGYGTVSSSAKGKRDSQLAISLLDSSASVKKPDTEKDKTTALLSEKPAVKQEAPATTPKAMAASMAEPVKKETGSIEPSSKNMARPTDGGIDTGAEGDGKAPVAKLQPQNQPSGKEEIKAMIDDVAAKTNTDAGMLKTMAAVESGLNPNASAKSSSAKGLYQFTNDTWKEVTSKYGSKYNIDPSTSPLDARANTFMASEYIKQNTKQISSVKPNPNSTDIYLSHFLGAGGAKKLLSSDPNANAAEVFPKAAGANPTVFKSKTIGQVYSWANDTLKKKAGEFGIDVPTSSMGGQAASNKPATTGSSSDTASIMSPAKTAVGSQRQSAQQPMTPQMPGMLPVPTEKPTTVNETPQMTQRRPLDQSGNLSLGGLEKTVSGVGETLTKSLTVQQQILEGIMSLVKTMSPEAIGELTKALSPAQSNEKAPQRQDRGSSRIPTPAVNLSRNMI